MARYLACLVYRLLTKGQALVDQGAAHFEKQRQFRDMAALVRRAAAMGLQLVPATWPESSMPTAQLRTSG